MMTARMMKFAGKLHGGSREDREGSNPIAMLATIILAPIAAMLIQAWMSRAREFVADAGGARIAGSPHGLISALRKLEMGSKQIPLDANPATAHMFIMKPFSAGGMLGMFGTHPPAKQLMHALVTLRQA